MAFNNPSSRTPVSYGSATKSLGYIVGTIGRAFSSDDDEGAQLLSKKKAKGESRLMAGACCCCILVLVCTVGGFIWMLQSMTYPGELHGAHKLKSREVFDARTGTYITSSRRKGSRGRNDMKNTAVAQRNMMAASAIGVDGNLKFVLDSNSYHLGLEKK
mmetsp:Transcript_13373/g.21222  ORF Transcript_13373/g.21222 Transcript_13373/m.21222 type:complete len:159 (+) Transcript_13373:83-559(+)